MTYSVTKTRCCQQFYEADLEQGLIYRPKSGMVCIADTHGLDFPFKYCPWCGVSLEMEAVK